jgi:hypothetical protein
MSTLRRNMSKQQNNIGMLATYPPRPAKYFINIEANLLLRNFWPQMVIFIKPKNGYLKKEQDCVLI